MKALLGVLVVAGLGCTGAVTATGDAGSGGGTSATGGGAAQGGGSASGGGVATGGGSGIGGGATGGGSTATGGGSGGGGGTGTPIFGDAGCGFASAAFCDTFDAPAAVQGRGGELDARYWDVGRMQGQLSTSRAMGIGMAVIPDCRPGVPTSVFVDQDTLVCPATADIASSHVVIGAAAQYYGQNGYRIRQPFDFASRTGKIVFDGTASPLSPLGGWLSVAVTEDPLLMPGYSLQPNDEGTIIPKNGFEVHMSNAPGSNNDAVIVRNVHVFDDYVDTVYSPDTTTGATYQPGKLNRYEVDVSTQQIAVSITPLSNDGATFGAPSFTMTVPAQLSFTRGYVQISVHNHATLKYYRTPVVVDAVVAQLDNVGFDGPVITNQREYEVPNAGVQFQEDQNKGSDPANPSFEGYDIGYVLGDAAAGPKQTLHVTGVDLTGATSARLQWSTWMDFITAGMRADYAVMARVNGHAWITHKLDPEQVTFFTTGPIALNPDGGPTGNPGTQGRFGFLVDVPLGDLVAGDNTVEFVSSSIPNSYPPLVCNVGLLLQTQ